MRKALLFVSGILFSLIGIGQISQPNPFPNFQSFGSATTWTRINGAVYAFNGIVNAEYADTTAANLTTIRLAPGAQIRVANKILYRNSTATGWVEFGSGSGSGTVTSVGLSAPSIFSVSGSPVTGSGTLALSLATQSANTVFSGPTNGAAATPTFRSLVAADIPTLSNYWGILGNTGTNPVTDFIGTTDAVAFVTKTNNSERMRVASGGNVGIGTNNPQAGLHVASTLRFATGNQGAGKVLVSDVDGDADWLNVSVLGAGIGSFQDSIANVRDYDAVGDGVTNDAAAIAAAIATGRTVYFPKGTYLLGTTVITLANRGQRLFGDGEASIIKTTKTDGAAVYVTGSYVQIDNIKFKGSEDGYAATSLPTRAVFSYQMAIWIHSPNNIIRDCFFDSIGGRAIYNIDPNVAVAQHYNNFTGNKFINVRVCIENDFLGEYTQISNNDFAGNYCGYYEGVAGNNTLFGNTFQANKRAIVLDGQGNGLHGSITANVINHNTQSAIEIQQGLTGLSITGNQFFDNSIFLGTVDTVANITFSNNQFGSSVLISALRVKLSTVSGGSFFGSVTPSGSGLTYNDVKNNADNDFEIGKGGAMYLNNSAGTSGQVLKTNGIDVPPTWVSLGTIGIPLSSIIAATATNDINNLGFSQKWNWPSASASPHLWLNSTGGSSATKYIMLLNSNGANTGASRINYGIYLDISNTGTTSTNTGLFITASGATTNHAIITAASAGKSAFGYNSSTSTAVVHTPSLELGFAGSTTGQLLISGTTSGTVTITVPSVAGTPTLTLPIVTGTIMQYVDASITSSATPTPQGDARVNNFYVTALAANAVFAAPSGTPTNGNSLLIRVTSDATPRTLGFNAIYRASSSIALPTTTVASETMYLQFVYNSLSSTWDFTGLTEGF